MAGREAGAKMVEVGETMKMKIYSKEDKRARWLSSKLIKVKDYLVQVKDIKENVKP